MRAARSTPIPFPASRGLTGRTVGRFAIRHKLGAGGMGEVYYADDTTLGRPVALKRVTRTIGSDPEARRHVLREAQRASTLNSEHIAAVHDVIEEDGEFFLVMEYVEGETLRQRLRSPISIEEFFGIAMQCAEALMQAHDHGIIHCDIKPENIMLTPSGQVKVLDFGVAKHLPRSDQSSTFDSELIGGTPSYMAPEVLLGKLPGPSTDIFSLGVVLYEILALKNPFFASSFAATSERILHQVPVSVRALNPDVPETLEAIVMRAMAKSATERYANTRELVEDLRRVRAGASPVKMPPPAWLPKQPRVKRWLAAGVVLLLAAGSGLAIYRWTHRAPVLAERGWVLVADFDTSGDETILDAGAREGLSIALQQSRYINVFPRSRAYEVLQRMKRESSPRINEAIGREICQRENLQVLLAGSIQRMGEVFQISVRGLDPVHGDVLFAERERFDRRDQFFDKLDSLAKQIRTDLGESLGGIEKTSRPLAKVTTSSLEALHLYSQAEDDKDQGKDDQVEGLLKGALRLDPDFAMAHTRLGQYYAAVIGKNEKALAELDRAYQLRREVTDREQPRIEAAFFDVEERYDEKVQSLRMLVSLYPDDEQAHSELAAAYYDLGQLDEAILEARETLRLNPLSAPAYGGLVLYLARANRAEAAIDAARQAEQHGVSSPRIHWALGLAYLGQNNVYAARQEFERIGRATETDRDLQALCVVVAYLYEGRLASAANELATQIQAVSPQSGGLQAFRRYLLGRIHLLHTRLPEAELQADLILRTPPDRLHGADLFHAGILYARAGLLPKARQVLRRLGELKKTIPSSSKQEYFRNLEGEISLAESNPKKAAISFLIPIQSYAPSVASAGLARAYQVERRWDPATVEWEKVLAEKGEILQNGFPPDLAITHLELARLYRTLKNLDLARKHYEEALRLWQHADEFNLLRDARQEYRQLSD
jgi:tetratricopeptide (TPR) repeat protein/predicted Ser/Thr protein kinase